MKILLTGGAGQLGQVLVKKLYRKHDVLPVDILTQEVKGSPIELQWLDITKHHQVKKLFSEYSPEVVINTAAMTGVDACELHSEKASLVNTEAVENLINCCEKSVLFVQISTDYVFDGTAGPYDENDVSNPNSIYGKTKLASENLIREKHPNSLIIRPNVLYTSSTQSAASFFAWVYTSLKTNLVIKVVTDQVSNPAYAPDLAKAIEFALDHDLTGIYHYGSCNYISRYEFALEIAEIFSLPAALIIPVKTADLRQAAARPAHSGLKTDKITAAGVRVRSTRECLQNILAERSSG